VLGWALGTAIALYSALYKAPETFVELVWLTYDGRLVAEDLVGKEEPLKDYELTAIRNSWRFHKDLVDERARLRTGAVVKSADGQYLRIGKDGARVPIGPEQLAKASRRVYSTLGGDLVVNDEGRETQRHLSQQELDSVEPTHYTLETVAESLSVFALGGLLAPLAVFRVLAWLAAGFRSESTPSI